MLKFEEPPARPKKKTFIKRLMRILFIKWVKRRKRIDDYLKKTLNENYELTESQRLAIKIFEKSLIHPNSELLFAPMSHTFYIDIDDVFLIMEGTELMIINGKYQYNIALKNDDAHELGEKFKRCLENKRKKMEKKILSKTTRSLSDILHHVTNSPGTPEV